MLNKPKFMKPSTNKEECTIDLESDEILFSCIVDGNESITAWQIKAYDITNDEEVFKTDEVPLNPPFYPVDEKNRNVVFSKNIKDHISDLDHPNFKNRDDAYYWTITFVGSSGNTTTSYQEVFYANSTPEIGFYYIYNNGEEAALTDGATITSKDCTFKATYSYPEDQENGVQLKRYGWKIIDTDNGQVLVDTITKNQIYGSSENIICKYDGFLNGCNYSVELFVETQNNVKITTAPIHFNVSYESTFLNNTFKVEMLRNEPAIMLDWERAKIISGVLKDSKDNLVSVDDKTFKTEYPVESHCSINIPDNLRVVYDKEVTPSLNVDENSYVYISTQLLLKKETVLFYAEGDDDEGNQIMRQLSYDEKRRIFRYIVIGKDAIYREATYEIQYSPSEYVWYNIFMSPLLENNGEYSVYLTVFESMVVDCIYPREGLYTLPENLYPIFGEWKRLGE